MTEFVWINGRSIPMNDAKISVEDRGFQFGDGVYEVIRIYNGRPFTLDEHIERLERSCAAIKINNAFNRANLTSSINEFIDQHGPADGMVYLQVSRGISPRNHVWPSKSTATVVFYTRPLPAVPAPGTGAGAKIVTVPDERWKKCWIKAIALLPNVLAKNEAVAAGADEAVFIENGIVSECSTSNFFAVIGGKVVTHPVGAKVLPGITRLVLSELAKNVGVEIVERPLSEAEARSADEIFITSTTRELSWVAQWDGKTVGGGKCGPITRKLHDAYVEKVKRETATAGKSSPPAMAAV